MEIGIKLKHSHVERKSVHSLEEVEGLLKNLYLCDAPISNRSSDQIEIGGEKIWAYSDRYYNFFLHGYNCVGCGLSGKYWALERSFSKKDSGRFHLNLYSVGEDGFEVLMTKDHIFPKSLGGRNHIENYQTMCISCNVQKGTKI